MRSLGQAGGGALRIIPVLDLKGGVVVRAESGRRDRYRPIATPLAATAEPVAVAEGLRRASPVRPSTSPISTPSKAVRRTPRRWRGCAPCPTRRKSGSTPASPSERARSLRSPSRRLRAGARHGIAARRGAASRFPRPSPAGPVARLLRRRLSRPARSLLVEPELWPDSVIVMTLARVGTAAGPDFAQAAAIKARPEAATLSPPAACATRPIWRASKRSASPQRWSPARLHDGTLTARPDARDRVRGQPRPEGS